VTTMTETRIAPSMPLILFALADTIARGGLPEPMGVEYDAGRGLELHFTNQTDARRWAEFVGIDHTDGYVWFAQEYRSNDGVENTLVNAYGRWHDADVRIHVQEPVDVLADQAGDGTKK
jgi:hypothetical protein